MLRPRRAASLPKSSASSPRATSSRSAASGRRTARPCTRGPSKATSTAISCAATRSAWSGPRSPAARRSSPKSTARRGSSPPSHVARCTSDRASSSIGFWPRCRDYRDGGFLKIGRSTRRILLESVFIVFSIMLALTLDSWRESRRETARLAELRAAFAEEIRGNLALLESDRFLPRHRELWRRFQALSRIEAPTDEDLAAVWTDEFSNGIWPTPFRSAVWRTLSDSELAARLPFDELFMLSDIYREQENVDGWHERMFTIWSESRSDRRDPEFVRDDVHRTRTYLADVVAGEERLLEAYREALEQLQ